MNTVRLGTTIVICIGVSLFSACTVVPITGRMQMNLVPESQLIAQADQQFSQLIIQAQASGTMLTGTESEKTRTDISRVQRVSERIVNAADLKGRYHWRAVVVQSKEVNAFVLPNGKIVVFTGLLEKTSNDGELAAVLGHEVGHVFAHHAAERLSQAKLANAFLHAADQSLRARRSKYRSAINTGLVTAAQFGLLLPFSREHESEADHLGLVFMSKAGYDPSQAVTFWEKMAETDQTQSWEFLSTHPNASTRRTQIAAWMPEAKAYYGSNSNSHELSGEPEARTAVFDSNTKPPSNVYDTGLQSAIAQIAIEPEDDPIIAREKSRRALLKAGRMVHATMTANRTIERGEEDSFIATERARCVREKRCAQ